MRLVYYPLAISALLLLSWAVAFADEPANVTLTLTPNEAGFIFQVLAKEPYQEVAALIEKMKDQMKAAAAKDAKK